MPTPDDADLARTIAEVEAQERELRFTSFTHDDAWRLGSLLVERAREQDLPLTIDIRRGEQQEFHAARPGTVPDNDRWVERKVRTVLRFGASSYLVGRRLARSGGSLEQQGLATAEYAAHGGAFPVHVEGAGIVGVVTVSGLPQAEDHAFVVAALREHLAGA
ncbi:heme-degrading domain-containing protein [Cellulomonas marina]|uniref:UPF0303 protein SAMN05421867_102308 n=1 Tax=Cellulomonas marina TaxID=988821 RepID=A0A1I0WBC5_9CELL|nr:heme-degrading domain-containing protein [Cellulomonas marina]GIG29073.1 UPF0303 protein [Cellulomonas marina]SFA85520.1 Uncharacterized protein, UPF0303 family [Cellulomonas marina]